MEYKEADEGGGAFAGGPTLGAFSRARRRGRRSWRYTCPTCKTEKALSADQKARGHQCDACADRDEARYRDEGSF